MLFSSLPTKLVATLSSHHFAESNLPIFRCIGRARAAILPESTEEIFEKIHGNLNSGSCNEGLNKMARYYFDGQGKSVRPRLTAAMAKAVNYHLGVTDNRNLCQKQQQVSLICEMYHTASLDHDDVIDVADVRRGKTSLNRKFGQKSSILAGNYTVAIANKILGQMGNHEVTEVMLHILSDLVLGELQQMSQNVKSSNYLEDYLVKTYNKTASLMAKSCRAVAILSHNSQTSPEGRKIIENAANFGGNVGMAFQLVDDWLDFQATAEQVGKPSGAADLKLGLATAPVLFAAEKHPNLKVLIKRKFSIPGDVELAFQNVLDSDGLEKTMDLAHNYSAVAIKNLDTWTDSDYKSKLIQIAQSVIDRKS